RPPTGFVQVFGRRQQRGSRHAQLTGVQKAPRHEVAGRWVPAGQRALWGFDVSADLDGGRNTARKRPGCVDRRGGEPAMGISASARSASAGARRIDRRDRVERDHCRRRASAPERERRDAHSRPGDAWLKNGANLLLFGPPGGRTRHPAAALGLALVENGWRVLFTRTTDLVQRLQIARRELAL